MTPSYRKAVLDLWAAAAQKTLARDSRRFLADSVQIRTPQLRAASYDAEERSAIACVTSGRATRRIFGTEILRTTPEAVDLSRLQNGGIPLLDAHNLYSVDEALGRVVTCWFNNGALMSKFTFNATEKGELAAGMVERGEICAVSPAYNVERWEITDENGREIDPEFDRIGPDDELIYTAARWTLLELSLVSVPGDPMAVIRSVAGAAMQQATAGIGAYAAAEARARMAARQQSVDDRAMATRDRVDTYRPRPAWQWGRRRPLYQGPFVAGCR